MLYQVDTYQMPERRQATEYLKAHLYQCYSCNENMLSILEILLRGMDQAQPSSNYIIAYKCW